MDLMKEGFSRPCVRDWIYFVPPLAIINFILRSVSYKILYWFCQKFITWRKGDEFAAKSKKDINKFAIKGFDYIYHLFCAYVIYAKFSGRDWFDPITFRYNPTMRKIWEEYQNPGHPNHGNFLSFGDKLVYNFFIGYRISEVTFHFLKDKGALNDLCLHHWIAVYLLGYLYLREYVYIFLLAQQLSMWTTIFAYMPILFNYMKLEIFAAITMPLGLLSFSYFRGLIVNVQSVHLIHFIWKYKRNDWTCIFDILAILFTIVIVILTFFWIYVFIKYFMKMLRKGFKMFDDMNKQKLEGSKKNISSWE